MVAAARIGWCGSRRGATLVPTMEHVHSHADYRRIERAIAYLEAHQRRQPSLEEVASVVGLSGHHFQRMFRRWAGISPKRYLQFLTAEHARAGLEASRSVLETAFEAGLSGPSRLHDLCVSVYAATPAELRRQGEGLVVRHGFAETPFGDALVASTERGLCALAFVEPDEREAASEALRARFRRARLVEDSGGACSTVERIFEAAARSVGAPLTLHLVGTNFQLRVWEALLRIPPGRIASYEEVASALGAPGSARAVGTAIGRNPLAFVVPCHRVLRKTGALGGYRWGLERKRAILAWEVARSLGDEVGEG